MSLFGIDRLLNAPKKFQITGRAEHALGCFLFHTILVLLTSL